MSWFLRIKNGATKKEAVQENFNPAITSTQIESPNQDFYSRMISEIKCK